MGKKYYTFRMYPNKTQELVFNTTLDICTRIRMSLCQMLLSGKTRASKKELRAFSNKKISELSKTFNFIELGARAVLNRMSRTRIPGLKNRYCSEKTKPCKSFSIINHNIGNSVVVGGYTKSSFIEIAGAGKVKCVFHRQIKEPISEFCVKKIEIGWVLCVICDCCASVARARETTEKILGIDVGINNLFFDSDGRYIKNNLDLINKITLARKKKNKKLLWHLRMSQREFFIKNAKLLSNSCSTICVERLSVFNMLKTKDNNLRNCIVSSGMNLFIRYIFSEFSKRGQRVVFVNPFNTSSSCSSCGAIKAKRLDERVHACPCGLELPRDHNAAINVLALGRKLLT